MWWLQMRVNLREHAMNRYVLLTIALALIPAPARSADDAAPKYPLLAQLSPREDDLPAGCKIAKIRDGDTPVKGMKNRAITTDAKAFLIVDERHKDLLDAKLIEAMYVGIYREKRDIGVIAWAFKTEDAAKRAHQKLADSYAKEAERFRFWRTKKNVVWLWRDPGTTDDCFRYFETFIEAVLTSFGAKDNPGAKPK
jgi:hypothetical protein